MKKSGANIETFLTLVEVAVLLLCFFPNFLLQLALVVFIVSLARLLQKIGNGSFFLELLYVYTCFICLLMPWIGYNWFTKSNELAVVWVRYMPVSEIKYFSFVLPAVVLTSFVFFTARKNSPDDNAVVDSLISEIKKITLSIRPGIIIALTMVSLFAYTISNILPDSFKQIGTFLYNSLFAGLFYIIYKKDFPFRRYYIIGIVLFIILDALRWGMFTIIAYMGGLFLILLLSGKRVSAGRKMALLVLGVVFIAFLQLYKLDLRKTRKAKGNEAATTIISNVISQTKESKFEQIIFPLYYRMNQGFNIALVQRRIPTRVDYLGGQYLGLTFASAFVPRLFWADKPQAGGIVNMKIYTGTAIKGWSTNVSPLGEAYGNFGVMGGWLYVVVFAMFIRFSYVTFIRICRKRPIFFLWMPPLFFQTIYVMETDSLQAFNSIIKGAIFIFLMYKLFPPLFPYFKTE